MDKWDRRFMDIAHDVASWSSCFQENRQVGAVIAKNATHAEQNAIIQAAKMGICIDGATLYCTHQPCSICTKMIINSGISRVVYEAGYPDDFSLELFEEAGVLIEKLEPETDVCK